MIAVDTSSFIEFLNGGTSEDVAAVRKSIQDERLTIPPVVLTETLSDPVGKKEVAILLCELPLLELHEGYWQRAASIRQIIRKLGLKARLADALIAQSCLDHDVPLITRDKDFRHYAKYCGLKLYA